MDLTFIIRGAAELNQKGESDSEIYFGGWVENKSV